MLMNFFTYAAEVYQHGWAARLDCLAEKKTPGLCLVDVTAANKAFSMASRNIMLSSDYCPGQLKQEVLHELASTFPPVIQDFMRAQEKAFSATAPGAPPGFDASDLVGIMTPVMNLVNIGINMAFKAFEAVGKDDAPGLAYLKQAFPVL